ncbi:hypothetical protein SAMN05428936_101972 [Pelagibacterium halotolerans]|nr:hypothetical protein SAMN05428936_101972 [Pelagibacterium halotolerans]
MLVWPHIFGARGHVADPRVKPEDDAGESEVPGASRPPLLRLRRYEHFIEHLRRALVGEVGEGDVLFGGALGGFEHGPEVIGFDAV